MPEGPEIRRAADKLAAVMIEQPLTEVWFAFPQLKHYQAELVGERITAIEPRGKALLTDFSNGLTMYSHNQLYGVWKVVRAGETQKPSAICGCDWRRPSGRFCCTALRISPLRRAVRSSSTRF